jgi:ABC-type nitrate/sulfonate/bicarbonate transport system substrate-binding protein
MHFRFSLLAVAVASALAVGLATLPAGATPTPQRATIRVGTPARVVSQWPFLMAMVRGTFAAYNLDVDFLATRTEPLSMQYLVSNSIDMVIASPGVVLQAVEAGATVTMIGGLQNKMTYALVARPEIRTLADLRGQSLATDQVRGTIPALTKALIAPSGLQADRDYELRVVGAISERFAAMAANQVAATLLAPPWDTRARGEGYTILSTTLQDLPPMQWNVYIVERGWANANRDALARFLAAVRLNADWLYDPSNREEAIRLLAADLSVDEAIIRENYAFMVDQHQVYSRDAAFDRQGVERYITLFVGEGLVPAPAPPLERYADLSFWEESLRR